MAGLLLAGASRAAGWDVSLAGPWEVSLDSLRTFSSINMPSTTDLAGLGEPSHLAPALEKPQLLHLTRRHSFIGKAFYRRTVDIPAEAAGLPLELELERVLWASDLWIDGKPLGKTQESLVAPHRFTIPGLSAGPHEIMIAVDNRRRYNINSGDLAHAYTDDTQAKWNGMLGRMRLRVVPEVEITRLRVVPGADPRQAMLTADLVKRRGASGKATVKADFGGAISEAGFRLQADTTNVAMPLAVPDSVRLWSEFDPALYPLTVACGGDTVSMRTGLRTIATDGSRLLVNGTPVFLRGTLECCVFPLTGTPPTDNAGWLNTFEAARNHGLNHLRFHSYCPPDAAFRVADSLGFYLQVELPNWSTNLGEPQVENLKPYLMDEYRRIIDAYGNHPSFCLLSVGNELQHDFGFLNNAVKEMKDYDPRRLYTTTTFTFEPGHGLHPEPEDQFFITQYTDNGWVRGQGVFNAEAPSFSRDYREAAAGLGMPLISHEIGQYAVYPDISEIPKYTGTLDPLNFKAVRDDLGRKGLLGRAREYTEASGRLASILYKEEIERAMKTPGFAGFQLLGLQDFPGQGTALVGLLDAFWDSKRVVEPEEFRQYCAPVVPLARFDKAVWTAGEPFGVAFEVANFHPGDLAGSGFEWSLTPAVGGKAVAGGSLPVMEAPAGAVSRIDSLGFALPLLDKPAKYILRASLDGGKWHNSWPIWVYPAPTALGETDVVVTADPKEAVARAGKGAKVLLTMTPDSVKGLEGRFIPVFWSPVHFPDKSGTMGLLCDPAHPALASFPNDGHGDWQWWRPLKQSKAMVIDALPGVTPVLEAVDVFTSNRRLSYMFEARCGEGSLMVSAIDLLTGADTQPETNALLHSVVRYMESPAFAPSGTITGGELDTLLQRP